MSKKHFKAFSASGFQIVSNQFLGLLFFILLAINIKKDVFGDVNWGLALSSVIFIILTFGFDHIVVRRISAGAEVQNSAGTYFTHALLVSSLLFILLLLHQYFFHQFHLVHQMFGAIFIGTLFSFLASPFKQVANGKEKFWHLAIMNLTPNLIKVLFLLALLLTKSATIINLSVLFIVAGAMDLMMSFMLSRSVFKIRLRIVLDITSYTSLIKEALPQMGVILLDSSFARIDWILMGILSTNVFTADYSFAYKAYESSRIPLLMIAPVILPKFSKVYHQNKSPHEDINKQLNELWRLEGFISMLIPLVLIVAWKDAINRVTSNAYGDSTSYVYIILSLAVPLAYITNFKWTIAFAKGNIKLTFFISLAVTLTNLVLNMVLIPKYNAIGAAIAFFSSALLQAILYWTNVKEPLLNLKLVYFLKPLLISIVIILLFKYLAINWILKVLLGLILYVIIAWVTQVYNVFTVFAELKQILKSKG